MNDLHGIIFAYGDSPEMRELTKLRNICSVPYGGRYRLVDFSLSNLVNAGVTDIGLIVHQSYQSMLDHVGSGKDWDLSRKRGGLRILPPFGYSGQRSGRYRGRMDALAGVHSYLKEIKQDYVVLCDGDLVANLPLDDIFHHHLETGADVTVVCRPQPSGNPQRSNYFTSDADGWVTELAFKPFAARGHQSLEYYILSKDLLLSMVDYAAAHNIPSFGDVLIDMRGRTRINTYVYAGYASHIQSVEDYFRSSMELLEPGVRADVFQADRPIRTKDQSNPSTIYGAEAVVANSLVADGCVIEGTVVNSVLCRGVHVAKGAKVENCILMQRSDIQDKVLLRCAITDKNVRITTGRMLMGHETYPLVIGKSEIV